MGWLSETQWKGICLYSVSLKLLWLLFVCVCLKLRKVSVLAFLEYYECCHTVSSKEIFQQMESKAICNTISIKLMSRINW